MSDHPIKRRISIQREGDFRKPRIVLAPSPNNVGEILITKNPKPITSGRTLSVTSKDLPCDVQAGCSTIAPGGYRKKVALKPGRSALDWSSLTMGDGVKGKLITGMEKHLANKDDDIYKINHQSTLVQVLKGVPLFMVKPPLRISEKMVAEHNTVDDCWCIIKGKVYCITNYFEYHPGGDKILKNFCSGVDATEQFYKYHAWVNANRVLRTCCIGELAK
ncbi:hypothetical protein TPHA_0G03550 [Tetrapisispora phaffii CBS 4417]|uniref:Cytochrome b5 heme-binding domain-containing protein n=1 Tax=Tetrapisispora phaffii (strain ATCC 24235 / CBS 4417 / NBRC 1672 / NRRL Y-8282 / UCD 70-5) TaxID=1071381 RepID=G8BWB7_TETPH|nr:hypothetical protein TPHA_0G03550 [Tetrapisispora phaffii CBS 4417]CCE64195.1 hypothetical protein TPHA_0G03550 [Tetrapisispora phaffii CBS 4417]